MSAREIPIAQWSEFLDRFTREHRAWLAMVDRVAPDASGHSGTTERPLASVRPQVEARRNARIEIRFQEGEPIHIDAPTSIRVDETAEGVACGLEIGDEDGGCTRIRFRTAPLPETLDGMAPGELPPS